jgi:hypothetical protein
VTDRPTIAVLDVDGVIADVRHRLHHVERSPKDWTAFFGAMDSDGVLPEGLATARRLVSLGHDIVYLTGRSEAYRRTTLDWMERHDLPAGRLVMRGDSDRRPARVFKPQALRRLAEHATVVAVVDDDDTVVAVLRRDGWPVLHATWMTTVGDEQQALFDAQETDGRT